MDVLSRTTVAYDALPFCHENVLS